MSFNRDGFVHVKSLIDGNTLASIREDAEYVFRKQMEIRSISGDIEEVMTNFFQTDFEVFSNCGKMCQHLIRLHKLALDNRITDRLGFGFPNICTRPVIYFNKKSLAQSDEFYKFPAHQDWRSMQGSMNATVVWIPLMDVKKDVGALQVIPGSHKSGLLNTVRNKWYRQLDTYKEEDFVDVEMEKGDALFFSGFLIHRSGNNILDKMRWSCQFRYNDLDEPTFIERGYPNPYIYKAQDEIITPDFPSQENIENQFGK